MAHHHRGDGAIGHERGEQLVGCIGIGEVDLVVRERLLVGSPLHPRVVAPPSGGGDRPTVCSETLGDRRGDANAPTDPGDEHAAG